MKIILPGTFALALVMGLSILPSRVQAAPAETVAKAQLPTGTNVLPYEIQNVASGEKYCQMCAYSGRAGTVAAYGNLGDEQFWSDLEKLQALQGTHKNFGFYGQVLDSTDAKAIAEQAKKHHVTFPVVFSVDPDWEKVYRVGGVSRTVYYSVDFKVLWTSVGLESGSLAKLEQEIKANPQS